MREDALLELMREKARLEPLSVLVIVVPPGVARKVTKVERPHYDRGSERRILECPYGVDDFR